MRIIFIICAILLSFSLAMPVIVPRPTTELLRAVNAKAHAVNKRTHVSGDCISFAEYREIGEPATDCGLASNIRVFPESLSSSSEDISGRNEHKVPAAPKSPKSASMDDANTAHYYHRFDYRRSPLLGILQEEAPAHRDDTSTSPVSSRVESTQSSPSAHKDAVDLGNQSKQTQETQGSQADNWGAYHWDWKL